MNIEIVPFKNEYAAAVSKIIIDNLTKINLNDYGDEVIKILCLFYTPDCIIRYSKNEDIFVALSDSEVIGTVSVLESRVRNLFVKIEFQRKGIGQDLIRFVESAAKEKNMERLFLSSNLSAVGFYEKLGFISVEISNEDVGGMNMRLNLMEKYL